MSKPIREGSSAAEPPSPRSFSQQTAPSNSGSAGGAPFHLQEFADQSSKTKDKDEFTKLYKDYCKKALKYVEANHDNSGRISSGGNDRDKGEEKSSSSSEITKQKIALNCLTTLIETKGMICVAIASVKSSNDNYEYYLASNGETKLLTTQLTNIIKRIECINKYGAHTATFDNDEVTVVLDDEGQQNTLGFNSGTYSSKAYLELADGKKNAPSFMNKMSDSVTNKNKLSSVMNSLQSLDLVAIADKITKDKIKYVDIQGEVHAEIKVLQQLLTENKGGISNLNILFGISKFCCPKCTALIYSLVTQKKITLCSVMTGYHQSLTQKWSASGFSILDIAGKEVVDFCKQNNIDDICARQWISEATSQEATTSQSSQLNSDLTVKTPIKGGLNLDLKDFPNRARSPSLAPPAKVTKKSKDCVIL